MFRTPLRVVSAILGCVLAIVSCGKDAVGPTGEAKLVLYADVSGTSVATVVVDVSAPDIPTPLVFNITVVAGVAMDTIAVPAGSNRTIEMRAYDVGGTETHSGSKLLNVAPGTNATIAITLQPLTGDVPITATLGSRAVAVTPNAATLAPNATAQLSATITDWNGSPVVGTVKWATHDPGVATVDNAGLVTAVKAGSTTVTATFSGAAGRATITVTP
ncbi:MAG TPA: Ig-like domain-containing protein [Gemmatimonadales bacterium]|nr:Ig-like domain-containing protein [Gemmatimonadales bacterium]